MKTTVPIALLTVLLLFSVLNVTSATFQCPRCHGTGTITRSDPCPICGGTVVAEPNIVLKRTLAGASGTSARPATSVTGIFHNEEDVGAYGVATAQVKASTETYTNTSARTYFPPNTDTTVVVVVEGIEYAQYLACSIQLSDADSIGCTACDGTGTVTVTIDCPDCGGTGFVAALPSGEDNSLVIGAAAVGVAAAVVIAVVVMVRRKRVTEESLRRLPPQEFQNWVIQRLSGRASSQKECSMGIDGYTVEGYPLQIKQLGDVGRNVIDSFASVIGRSRARTGVIVAFSFDQGTFEGTVRAKLHYGFEIKTVTVRELIEGSGRAY